MMINCAGFLERSRVNGPGERAVLWVQGCFLHCPGCFNRSLWSFKKNHLVRASDIADTVLSLPGIDGITFSGGEPFCQALPLAEVGELVQKEGLTVVTFSGFPSDTLISTKKRSWKELLKVTDLLVAGPYIRECTSGISLCGSTNQEQIFLSERIPMKTFPDCIGRTVEYTISSQGEITTTGFPESYLFHHETGCI